MDMVLMDLWVLVGFQDIFCLLDLIPDGFWRRAAQ